MPQFSDVYVSDVQLQLRRLELEQQLELKKLEVQERERERELERENQREQRQHELRKLELELSRAPDSSAHPTDQPSSRPPPFRVKAAVKLVPKFLSLIHI